MKNRKRKLLILGGGYSEIPLIQAAKMLGYHVITSGNRAEDLGHAYSNEYQPIDFSDEPEVLKMVEKQKISLICPCANDFSALSASYTAERLGLPGHDSYETCKLIHHKDKFRRFTRANGISAPKAQSFSGTEESEPPVLDMSYPYIIKPIDMSGGKGISIVRNRSKLNDSMGKAFNASKSKQIVIEEYIEGTNHGFSCFLYRQKVALHFSDNEHYYLNPFMVSAASTPGNIPESAIQMLIGVAEQMATELNLKDGIFHVQFILKNGIPYIVEICRRPPGDLYIQFVKYATGLDFPLWILRGFLGEDCSELRQKNVRGFFTRHCIMASKKGILRDIVFDASIQGNIVGRFMWWRKGEEIYDTLVQKFGIVFLRFETEEEMLFKTTIMQELIKVTS